MHSAISRAIQAGNSFPEFPALLLKFWADTIPHPASTLRVNQAKEFESKRSLLSFSSQVRKHLANSLACRLAFPPPAVPALVRGIGGLMAKYASVEGLSKEGRHDRISREKAYFNGVIRGVMTVLVSDLPCAPGYGYKPVRINRSSEISIESGGAHIYHCINGGSVMQAASSKRAAGCLLDGREHHEVSEMLHSALGVTA
jgi:hypothetical protein